MGLTSSHELIVRAWLTLCFGGVPARTRTDVARNRRRRERGNGASPRRPILSIDGQPTCIGAVQEEQQGAATSWPDASVNRTGTLRDVHARSPAVRYASALGQSGWRDAHGDTPDPSTVRDVAGFVHACALLKVWAGDPSFDQLARRSVCREARWRRRQAESRATASADVVRSFVPHAARTTEQLGRRVRRLQFSPSAVAGRVLPANWPPDVMGFRAAPTWLRCA